MKIRVSYALRHRKNPEFPSTQRPTANKNLGFLTAFGQKSITTHGIRTTCNQQPDSMTSQCPETKNQQKTKIAQATQPINLLAIRITQSSEPSIYPHSRSACALGSQPIKIHCFPNFQSSQPIRTQDAPPLRDQSLDQ